MRQFLIGVRKKNVNPFATFIKEEKEQVAMKFDIHADAPFDIKQDIDDFYYSYQFFINVVFRCGN